MVLSPPAENRLAGTPPGPLTMVLAGLLFVVILGVIWLQHRMVCGVGRAG
jgi:hypothetical protein